MFLLGSSKVKAENSRNQILQETVQASEAWTETLVLFLDKNNLFLKTTYQRGGRIPVPNAMILAHSTGSMYHSFFVNGTFSNMIENKNNVFL